jgi:hypothetical protein
MVDQRASSPVRAPAALAIAAHGLPTRWTLPDAPLDDAAWSTLLSAATGGRLLGLLADAARTGAMATTAEQHRDLSIAADRWLSSNLGLERLALVVDDVLEAAAVPRRFLKGLSLAHTVYARPDLRVFGDIDLAVPSAHIVEAIEVLGRAVGPRMEPELNRGFDREFGKGATLKGPDGNEVDLHRTLVWGALGLSADNDDLFVDATPFELGRHRLLGLDPDTTFLHACYTAVLGDVPPRLIALRDVAEVLASSAVDIDRTLAIAERWRARAVVALAVQRAWDGLELTIEHPFVEWSRAYEPAPFEELLLRSHLMAGGTYARRVSAVAVLPDLSARVRYLRSIVLPSREYLASRDFTWGHHLRRSLAFLRPRRARL